jgi:hypothetical protein
VAVASAAVVVGVAFASVALWRRVRLRRHLHRLRSQPIE